MQAVRKGFTEKCKCHGVSGSCTTKTCWMQMQPFVTTADALKDRYHNARRVIVPMNNLPRRRKTRLIIRRRRQKPKPGELVYLQRSPSFCERSDYSPGTRGRKCQRDSGDCDKLCCGRGFNTRVVNVTSRCNCKVIWCCDVACDTCHDTREIHECK